MFYFFLSLLISITLALSDSKYDGYCESYKTTKECHDRQLKLSHSTDLRAIYLSNTRIYYLYAPLIALSATTTPLTSVTNKAVLFNADNPTSWNAMIADFDITTRFMDVLQGNQIQNPEIIIDVMLSHMSSSVAPQFNLNSPFTMTTSTSAPLTQFMNNDPQSTIYAKRYQIAPRIYGSTGNNPVFPGTDQLLKFYYNLSEDARINKIELQLDDKILLSVRAFCINCGNNDFNDAVQITGTLGYQYSFP